MGRTGCPEKLTRIAQALGENVDGLSAERAPSAAWPPSAACAAECEVEEPLSSHGMTEEAVQICAERVFAQHAPRSIAGPRGFRNLDEVLSVLRAAY